MIKQVRFFILVFLIALSPQISISQVKLVKETCLTNNDSDDRYASYSPNGDKIIFESNRDGHWEIYLMDFDGKNQKRITNGAGNNRRPGWHPNGKKILFESDESGSNELYTLKLANGKRRKITSFKDKGKPVFGSFSPDGKSVALSLAETENRSNIVVINRRGKIIRQITQNEFRNTYPKWSNKGESILYFSRKETDNQDDEIYCVRVEDGTEARLTNWPKHNFCPAWSNDDKRIVYVTSMEEVRPEIFIMDADGQNAVRITNNEDGDTLPDWSPSGDKLLITGYRNGNFEICELELNLEEN